MGGLCRVLWRDIAWSPLERTYVAFWGAWAAFYPETHLWEG